MKPAWGLALAGLLQAATAQALQGTVTRVSDGDTLWIRPAGGGKPQKVRLQGLDAPESCQAWGAQATQALKSQVLNRTVRLEEGPRDAHGRRLGRLMQGDLDVGAWMVSQGHAWSHRWRWQAGPYAAQEQDARSARRGLFAQDGAQAPSAFRRLHGPCAGAPASP